MARPFYENSTDRANEESICLLIEEYFRVQCLKLPTRYIVDRALIRSNKIVAWAEIKDRGNTFRAYPDYTLSLHKVIYGIDLYQRTQTPFIVVVRWKDFVGWMQVKKVPEIITIGGRVDRNDKQDVEPMAHFPLDTFNKLTE